MMDRSPVMRKSIKIRRSIFKDYCNCHDVQVFSSGATPYLLNVDRLTFEELHLLLSGLDVCTPIYMSDTSELRDKAELCLNYGLPVTIRTNRVLPESLLEKMKAVPHSALHVSIKFLDPFIRSRLDSDASAPSDLQPMMRLAKSWKIFQALVIEYQPYLVANLDTMEIVEMVKNHIRHVIVEFPVLDDMYVRSELPRWEVLGSDYDAKFRHFCEPNPPTRSWSIKPKFQQEFFTELSEFSKAKRLSIEAIEWKVNDRTRHAGTIEDYPLGMRPFMYRKGEDGRFVETVVDRERPCSECGRTLFI